LGEAVVSAEPLLHECGTEAGREGEAETEEPEDVYVNGIAWGLVGGKGLSGHCFTAGEGS